MLGLPNDVCATVCSCLLAWDVGQLLRLDAATARFLRSDEADATVWRAAHEFAWTRCVARGARFASWLDSLRWLEVGGRAR